MKTIMEHDGLFALMVAILGVILNALIMYLF